MCASDSRLGLFCLYLSLYISHSHAIAMLFTGVRTCINGVPNTCASIRRRPLPRLSTRFKNTVPPFSLSLSLSELLWRRFRLQDDDADTDGAQPQQQQSAEPASMATVGGEHQPLISDGDENERTMLLGHAAVPQYKGKPHTCAPPALFPVPPHLWCC